MESYDEIILGAIARGWCTKENESKVMDPNLVKAIAVEIFGVLNDFEVKATYERIELRSSIAELEAELEKWKAFFDALPGLIEPFRKIDSAYIKLEIARAVGLEV